MADVSGVNVLNSKKKSRSRKKSGKRKSKLKEHIRNFLQNTNLNSEVRTFENNPDDGFKHDVYNGAESINYGLSRQKHVSGEKISNCHSDKRIDENRRSDEARKSSLYDDPFLDTKFIVLKNPVTDQRSGVRERIEDVHNFNSSRSGVGERIQEVRARIEEAHKFNSYSFQNADYSKELNYLLQENHRLKEALYNVDRQWITSSDKDVDIVFKRIDLQVKYQSVLKDVIRVLLTERLSVEDLKNFLKNVDSPAENSRESPEGDKFFFDILSTPDPGADSPVPKYEKSFSKFLQPEDPDSKTSPEKRSVPRKNGCYNCSEDHHFQDCPYKVDHQKVAAARNRTRTFYASKVRYHVHNKKEADFKPGVISEDLRDALDLKSNQLPPYIYRMRILGYPPGWYTEAAVENSGITVYGSDGNVEKGDCEDGHKQTNDLQVQLDRDKLVNYPGFNVVASSEFVDECDKLGLPAMQYENLRLFQDQFTTKPDVRPKRKRKISQGKPCKIQRCEEDMEIEDDSFDKNSTDVQTEFVPPLPVECLPPPPKTPPPPLPFEDAPPLPPEDFPPLPPEVAPPLPPEEDSLQPVEADLLPSRQCENFDTLKQDDSEPLPPGVESLPFSDDSSSLLSLNSNFPDKNLMELWKDKNFEDDASGTSSPSLKELEEIKRKLVLELTAAEESETSEDIISREIQSTNCSETLEQNSVPSSPCSFSEPFVALESSNSSVGEDSFLEKPTEPDSVSNASASLERSESRTSKSKLVMYGTPSLSRHSSYKKLPDYEQFSKNVTSHQNFENLPNSTGTYQKMKGVLKKVKEKLNSYMR